MGEVIVPLPKKYFMKAFKIEPEANSNVFFSSDFHYNHKNIVSGTTNWSDKDACRQFDTLEEHNQALIDNINSVVRGRDILIFLGDWSFGGIESIWDFRKQLNCKKIFFIYGNHDKHFQLNRVLPNAKYVEGKIIYGKPTIMPDHGGIMIRRDAHDVVRAKQMGSWFDHYKEIKLYSQPMVLCHFPMKDWNDREHMRNSWMIHGHTHGKINQENIASGKRIMDVGIDTHPEFRPYSFDEMKSIIPA